MATDRPPILSERSTPSGGYREVTISAVVFGIVVGAIMNAAITYAGLKIGFTLGGSAIAAVLGFGVLRGLLRRGSILETNIGQTIASAVNTTNAGVIFTVPVLLLLGHTLDAGSRDFWLITLACVAGAVLGCVFIVPLRKQMLDIDRLRFPSATAVGAILKSPGAGAKKSIVLVIGIVAAVLVYLPVVLPNIRFAASLEQLDALVERERISPADAERTRAIAEWIAAREAPETVLERGRLLKDLSAARQALADDEENAELQLRVRGLDDAQKAIAEAQQYSPALVVAAHEAALGQRSWESLRSTRYGWAGRPLPGYQDLQIRLRPQQDEAGKLTRRVDRNGDGRPDLVVTDGTVDVGRILRLPDEMALAFAIAPLALGAGYLTGKAGLLVLAGGVLAYLVLNPLAYNLGWFPATVRADQAPQYALVNYNRHLGIGLLLGGALMGIVASLPAMREAIRSIAATGAPKLGSTAPGRSARSADEVGLKTLLLIGGGAMLLLLIAAEFSGGGGAAEMTGWLKGIPPSIARILIAIIAAVWIWFAGIIIAQCTGMTDWSPISGMALLTVILVMLLSGTQDVVSAVMLGAALCVAISCAADMMADLKTGYIVGGVPRRQQLLEIASAGIGPLITMGTILLIASVNMRQFGVPIGPGTETVAPQAQALEAVVRGVQGGDMPYAFYGLGAALGVLLGLGAFSGLGVLVGLSMYLPIIYILTYGLGCVMNIVIGRIKGRAWAEEWGVPFCAGLIVGEAVLALLVNSVVLLQG